MNYLKSWNNKNENDLDDFINFIDNLNSQLPTWGFWIKVKSIIKI